MVENKDELDYIVGEVIKEVFNRNEVKDRLDSPGNSFRGQQQRLCIARTIAAGPEAF